MMFSVIWFKFTEQKQNNRFDLFCKYYFVFYEDFFNLFFMALDSNDSNSKIRITPSGYEKKL